MISLKNKNPFRPKGWRDPNATVDSWWKPGNTANKDSWWKEAEKKNKEKKN